MNTRKYIGVDIGGTSIVAARFSEDELIEKNEAPTGANRPAEEILESLYSAIQPVLTDEVVGIGIGMPGFMDTESGEIFAINNIPSFQGVSVKKAVEHKYGLATFQNNASDADPDLVGAGIDVLPESGYAAQTVFPAVCIGPEQSRRCCPQGQGPDTIGCRLVRN